MDLYLCLSRTAFNCSSRYVRTSPEERASLFEQTLSPNEKKLYERIGIEPVHVDELVEATGLSSSEALAALCEMEMRGMIRQMPGKQFIKSLM